MTRAFYRRIPICVLAVLVATFGLAALNASDFVAVPILTLIVFAFVLPPVIRAARQPHE